MTAAVIGATGRVGSEIVRGLLARGDPVAALVRDPDKARHAFGEPVGGLTRDQPASPLQHRPVRLVERGAVLDDPPRHLLGVAARRGARGARIAHLTGPVPMSWPDALELLSAELGEPVTFRIAAEPEFLERLIRAGVPAGTAELLIAREWSILAGENDYTTDTFQQITGRPPRPVAEFLRNYHAEFV